MNNHNILQQIVSVGFAVLCGAWQSDGQAQLQCGDIMSSYAGRDSYNQIPARYNGIYQGKGTACAGLDTYGYQYQCVEYVKRFYNQALNTNTACWPPLPNGAAYQLYNHAASYGLVSHPNIYSYEPPAPDDILVFVASGKNEYGHVAIITDVSEAADGTPHEFDVSLIEQNWSKNGAASVRLVYDPAEDTYRINPRGSFNILGWLRPLKGYDGDEGTTPDYDFAVDQFTVIGNIPDFVDEFNDGYLTREPTSAFLRPLFSYLHGHPECENVASWSEQCAPFASDVYFPPNYYECGGFLHFRGGDGDGFNSGNFNPGTDKAILRSLLTDGRGNSTITASFRADTPRVSTFGSEYYRLGIYGGRYVSINVRPGSTPGAASVTAQTSDFAIYDRVDVDLSAAVGNRIWLRLFFDDATNTVTPSFSINGINGPYTQLSVSNPIFFPEYYWDIYARIALEGGVIVLSPY